MERPARRILFHSYHFPPIGGSGAQRPLKMVRYLNELGYVSIVVTSGGIDRGERWAPEDASLLLEIPTQVTVHRLPAADEPPPTSRLRPLAERWLGIRDR